ncbi:hypothetical protein GWK47_054840 [Chionoecetes opilio]|uniref:Uncharacterized protein n=1 Tax=Chionoecetes opilio TaxID=41210 RepID=A0A8J4Y448_CHIOP|nr:hypothetical protein GWK47_054840 [Chionoecetes opilio]
MKDIVDLAHTVGVKASRDMTEEDVAELIDSHGADPSVEEIIQMNEDDQAGDDADEDDDTETRPVFTIMKFEKLVREADNLTKLFHYQDPIQERSTSSREFLDEGLIPYKETLRSMEASACQKPSQLSSNHLQPAHQQEAFKHCYTSCYYTSQAACYSCYTR